MKRSKYFLNFFMVLLIVVPFFISALDTGRGEKIRNIVRFANDPSFIKKLLERYSENKRERRNLLIDSMVYAGKYRNNYTNYRMKLSNLKKLHKELDRDIFERHPLIAGLASFGIIKYGLEYFMRKYKKKEANFTYWSALLAIYVFVRCSS